MRILVVSHRYRRTKKGIVQSPTVHNVIFNPRWNYQLGNKVQFMRKPHKVIGIGRDGTAPVIHLAENERPTS